jgi:hypothetical protein
MANKKITKAHCNGCGQLTKHDCLFEKTDSHQGFDDHGYEYEWSATTSLLECRGCEEISMRVGWWHSEYDASDEMEFYPPRISRKPPGWLHGLPRDWERLLREIYSALHANSRSLAMMGARTIVDVYMNDAVGDIGGFAAKLKKLVTDGYLGSQDKEILEAALEAGHAAAHRGHAPSPQNVNHVMDIVENLLQKYALRNAAAKLSKTTPRRLPKPPVSPTE